MEIDKVAGGGAADMDAADMGVVVINTHRLQTLDAPKMAEMLAKATVAEGFHGPQECFIHRRQLVCCLMHRT
jgi:hypothetical protein